MLFGGAFTWGATRYDMGTAARMGAGYFPFILGGLLILLGVIVFVRSLAGGSRDHYVSRVALKPMVMMFGSIAAFALLLRPAGMVLSTFAIILISSFASRESRFRETLISAVVLCASCVAMFVYGGMECVLWQKQKVKSRRSGQMA